MVFEKKQNKTKIWVNRTCNTCCSVGLKNISKPRRPGTATLYKLLLGGKRTNCGKPETQQQFNSRTYWVKTKGRKSVLSVPEVSKQAPCKYRKSHLPVKVKNTAPPVRSHPVQKTCLQFDLQHNIYYFIMFIIL